MTSVLVIDDEGAILRALRINLSARNYTVTTASDGASGLSAMARDRPDAVILDLGLPDMDGTDVIRGIRGWSSAPIIVLSANGQELQKVQALDAGADDYVTKPFGMNELLARLRAATRRAAPGVDEPVVVTPHFTIDLGAKRVSLHDGPDVRLTPTEWQLLEVLARHRGRLVTGRQLLQDVWGPAYETETHYLRVYVAQLRRKLEPDPARPQYLLTEPGMGYRLVAT
ncbi:MAG: two-component system, OmpR family, operon response regulator KdpE [Actinomycetota bacterium]|jgi:two-component system KDP operon response regulator KdpE|nr:two-component system, OmpR family, operon response regulator KdpE [Actinomycetota bacterium]